MLGTVNAFIVRYRYLKVSVVNLW